jgi:copper chaperone
METTLKVNGMTCNGCVRSVTNVLKALPGVDEVEVSLERGEARVRHHAPGAVAEDMRRAIVDAGFEAV